MKRNITALCAISLLSAIGCGPGFPPGSTQTSHARSCGPGTHMEESGCTPNRIHEDCSGSIDADGDGLVPALDPDCADGGTADGGSVMDAGSDAGMHHADAGPIPSDCHDYCFMKQSGQYRRIETDAGPTYVFASSNPSIDGNPMPSGPGITLTEVGLPIPRALKVCYAPDKDADGDGVLNRDDNCWLDRNPPRGCTSNSGCENAGGVCSASGVCVGQLDSDQDGVGDVCDQNPGQPDTTESMYSDPDCDNDGIPIGEDKCPATQTTQEENAQDSDGDGIPDVCDPCAYPNMSCQH